jgi:Helix-turn-helix domain
MCKVGSRLCSLEAANVSIEHSPAGQRGNGRRHDIADRFLSRAEAADYLGLTTSQLAHDRCHGRLGVPMHKFGQRTRYRLSELDRWAESRRAAAA